MILLPHHTCHLVQDCPECLRWAGLLICCVVCRDPNLHFVEQVALKPPEVVIDTVQQAQYEQQLADAANAPLPDEDDDIAE